MGGPAQEGLSQGPSGNEFSDERENHPSGWFPRMSPFTPAHGYVGSAGMKISDEIYPPEEENGGEIA